MWKIVLHEPKFLPDKEFTITVEDEPSQEDAEMARARLMAKRCEIVELKEAEPQ